MQTITRTFAAERAADGYVTLSTETPCPQDGLILAANGWDLSRFEKIAPKMFYNHSTFGSDDFPVGRWEDVKIADGKLLAKPVFAAEAHPERAGVIAKLWAGGFLDDVSVSFRVKSDALTGPVEHDGRKYMVSTSHELLECSVVGIGADPNAGKGRIAEAVSRGVITDEEAAALDTVRSLVTENESLTAEREALRVELESAKQENARLREELAARTPPVLKIAASPSQPTPERVNVSPAAIRQAVEEKVAATIRSVAEDKLRVLRGRLPD